MAESHGKPWNVGTILRPATYLRYIIEIMTKFFDDPHHHLKVAITKEGQAMAGAEVAQVSIATGRSDA
jgi:hypothetical protein